jgi:stage II sporulation protein AA (anti-sigma F factor antagonist)
MRGPDVQATQPPDQLVISCGARADSAIVSVCGELDLATGPLLADALASTDSMGDVVVDMREVTFIDASGLGVLLAAARQVADRGRALTLVCGADGVVERLLALAGVRDRLTVCRSLCAAPGAA